MRLSTIAIAALLSLSACDSDHEKMIKAKEKFIQESIREDWRSGIPLDALAQARQLCIATATLRGCEVVQQQLKDISTSFASCRADQRSTLCQAVVRAISKHPIVTLLPNAEAQKLPNNPWYGNLPTAALDAHASNFKYRRESASWWWQAWGSYILSCIALLFMVYGGWFWWSEKEKEKQQRAAAIERQRVAQIEQEKERRFRKEQMRADVERLAELERQTAIEEQELIKAGYLAKQERLAAEKLAEQQATEAAAKLAAEQAEAASLLEAVFTPSKPKRRKRATSSQ